MFDPTYPPTNALIESAPLRGQFTGLKDLIDAVPTITGAQVQSTSTVPASSPASAQVSLSGGVLQFTFEIPQGQEGPMGQQGPPFAQAVVDGVTTGDPGTPAAVSVSFDGAVVHFSFAIPQGLGGDPGPPGNDGSQGPPGEVTLAQLNSAINGTSANTNAVSTLDTPFTNDPPTLADLELLRTKLNELILNGRR